jgi:hypothetical protein
VVGATEQHRQTQTTDSLTHPGVRALLTDRERQAAGRALFDNPRSLAKPDPKDAAKAPASRAEGSTYLLRTAAGYPPGFMSGVFAETGCDLTSVNTVVGGGEVVLRSAGRAQRITLVDQAASGCARAPRDLLTAQSAEGWCRARCGECSRANLRSQAVQLADQPAEVTRAGERGDPCWRE